MRYFMLETFRLRPILKIAIFLFPFPLSVRHDRAEICNHRPDEGLWIRTRLTRPTHLPERLSYDDEEWHIRFLQLVNHSLARSHLSDPGIERVCELAMNNAYISGSVVCGPFFFFLLSSFFLSLFLFLTMNSSVLSHGTYLVLLSPHPAFLLLRRYNSRRPRARSQSVKVGTPIRRIETVSYPTDKFIPLKGMIQDMIQPNAKYQDLLRYDLVLIYLVK